MKKILVALDLSEASNQVTHTAVSLGRQLGASLTFLHVVEPVVSNVPIGAAMDVIEVAPPPITSDDLDLRSSQLSQRVASAASGIDFTAVAVLGMAADEIVEQAKSCQADFIVLGSHGHGAIYHLFAGSVVTGVLKRSEIPVIVVPVGHRSAA
jgi:nucleotide-binding universal stress UspA family protein